MAPSPPGWYPQEGRERYWNGTSWTKRTRPVLGSPAASKATPPPPVPSAGHPGNASPVLPAPAQPSSPAQPLYPTLPPANQPPSHPGAAPRQAALGESLPAGGSSAQPTYPAPPGWYHRDGHHQWWDGTVWREHYQPAAPNSAGHHATPGQPAHQPYAAAGHTIAPQLGQPMVTRKSGALCVIAAFFIPGLGSILAERTNNGLIQLIGYFSAAAMMGVFGWLFFPILIALPIMFCLWIWGMADAAQGATEWNRRHGFPE